MTTPTPEGNSRGKVAAVILLVVLLGGSAWLVHRLSGAVATQDCVATGRHDC